MRALPYLLLFLLCLIGFLGFAQPLVPLDSIRHALRTAQNDSLKVALYQRLGTQMMAEEPDSGLYYYEQALAFSSKKGLIDEAVSTRILLVRMLQKQGRLDSAMQVARVALNLSQKAAFQKGIVDVGMIMARLHFLHQRNDSIIHYFEIVAEAASAATDSSTLATIYSNLGLLYQYQGRFEKANEYNFKGLLLKEQIHHPLESIASSHNNIALSYQELGKLEEAIHHQQIALKTFRDLRDTANIAERYYMIGGCYYEMNELDSARVYYDQAYKLSRQQNDAAQISVYHTYIGLISMKEGELEEAAASFKTSLETFPEDGQKRAKVFVFSNLAEVYLKMGTKGDKIDRTKLLTCIRFAEQTLALATELPFLDQMRKASEHLYKAHDALGQTAEAMTFAKQYILLNDSLYNDQKQKAVEEMQTKYETEKKEAEIEFLDRENTIKAKNLEQADKLQKNQRLTIWVLALGVLATGLLLIWIFRIYVQKKKANAALELKNNIISQQNDEKALLLKEIHHRVKNNLQVVSSLLDLQSIDLDNLEALAAVTDGQNRVKAMALIHEKLYQNENIVNLDFQEYATQLMKQTAAIFPGKGRVKQVVNAPNFQLDIDTAVPLGLILSELLTNAYKYAFADGEGVLSIAMIEHQPGHYTMTVSDNGPGFPADVDLKNAKSLGLKLVRRLSKQLYGRAVYHNHGGAEFQIHFLDTFQRKTVG